jgi:hypothetical protein
MPRLPRGDYQHFFHLVSPTFTGNSLARTVELVDLTRAFPFQKSYTRRQLETIQLIFKKFSGLSYNAAADLRMNTPVEVRFSKI